ncbi:FMN-binding protein [Arthrobacter sp. UYEF20]|uniref:FMN-binding protein n=1 Tax=Arthrobacter sp. UYEF20 TaxID=1756363 RepID=UPI003393707E
MRIRAAVSASLASAGILLVGWQSGGQIAETGSAATGTSAGASAGSAGSTGPAPGSSGSSSASGAGSSGSSGSSGADGSAGATSKAAGTYDGAVVQTRFGAVQVQITVQSGTITDVKALQLTDAERKSVQISNRAAPLLRAEVLKAQSASVQTISGATVTSVGYLNSLQAALDAANL